jgi:transcriptional regulator with XRE-family HTH domain
MTEVRSSSAVADVRQLRHRQLLDRLDYLRGLRRLSHRMTQSDLARALGLTQPSISSALKSAAKVADPRPGFAGASPYEIAQRYTAGELDRDEMIDQLGRWVDPGAHRPEPDETNQATDAAETMEQLRHALRDGLLDEPAHQLIIDRLGRHTSVGSSGG